MTCSLSDVSWWQLVAFGASTGFIGAASKDALHWLHDQIVAADPDDLWLDEHTWRRKK